jgi:hypothetical protein
MWEGFDNLHVLLAPFKKLYSSVDNYIVNSFRMEENLLINNNSTPEGGAAACYAMDAGWSRPPLSTPLEQSCPVSQPNPSSSALPLQEDCKCNQFRNRDKNQRIDNLGTLTHSCIYGTCWVYSPLCPVREVGWWVSRCLRNFGLAWWGKPKKFQ